MPQWRNNINDQSKWSGGKLWSQVNLIRTKRRNYIINGVIDELEIVTADSTQIDANNIGLERVEYEINQEVVMKK